MITTPRPTRQVVPPPTCEVVRRHHACPMVYVMTEAQQTKDKKTLGSRLASTVLVFIAPVLLLAIIGLFTGGVGIGVVELTFLLAIWVVGLTWVWWPRRG